MVEVFVPAVEIAPFVRLEGILRKWFYEPDIQAIRIALGAIQGHYLNIGDPAWLFVVAPPGAGKTTMSILGAASLSQVVTLGDYTENTFLSGFYGHQTPGLLEKLGTPKQEGTTFTSQGDAVFLAKDFTTVLGMRREKRGAILAQLREIHDGQFRRDFGTGQTKIWKGRVTIIAAVTPVLDKQYSVLSTLGERFLQVRWHRPNAEAGEWAIRQQGKEGEIRRELCDAVDELFKSAAQTAPVLPDVMRHRISCLAELAAIGRTFIYRNAFGGREIEFVPEPEANTRISKGLAAIAKGVAALNQHAEVEEQDLQDAMRVGIDGLPEYRRRILLAIIHGRDLAALRIPRTMRERELENLRELMLLETEGGVHKLSPLTEQLWVEAMALI